MAIQYLSNELRSNYEIGICAIDNCEFTKKAINTNHLFKDQVNKKYT